MDKWTTLEPVKLYGSGAASASSTPSRPKAPPNPNLYARYIGPLPVDIHVQILHFLPTTSLPAYALGSRALARLLHDDRIWKRKCAFLRLQDPTISTLLAKIENPTLPSSTGNRPPPVLEVQAVEEDEFGDFATAPLAVTLTSNGFGEVASYPGANTSSPMSPTIFGDASNDVKPVLRTLYIHAHRLLRGLTQRLPNTAPHLLLTALFPPPHTPGLRQQAQTLALLMRYLSAPIQPLLKWSEFRSILASAIDRFQAGVLATFEAADAQSDENLMTEAAWSSWEVWEVDEGVREKSFMKNEWELGRVWAEKLEIFYETSQWDPTHNFTLSTYLITGCCLFSVRIETNMIWI